jgi:hypothetical protein
MLGCPEEILLKNGGVYQKTMVGYITICSS